MRSINGVPLRAAAALCACALVLASAGCGRRDDRGRRMEPGLWQSDIDAMTRRLGERHAGLHRSVERATLDAAIERLVDSLVVRDEDEVIAELSRILALVGDAHTRIEWSSFDARFRRLPLELRSFGKDLRVTAAAPHCREALGKRLVSIGGIPTAEVAAAAKPLISRDNHFEDLVSVPRLLCYGNVLSILGSAPDPFSARMAFAGGEGDTVMLDLRTLPPDSTDTAGWETVGPPRRPPRGRGSTRSVSTGRLDGGRALLLTFGEPPRGGSLIGMLNSFLGERATGAAERIIFDLRGVDDPAELGLQSVPDAVPGLERHGREAALVVLVDRGTFAAGLELAVWLREKLGAAVVGESPRGRPNGARVTETIRLPNSGLRVGYAAVLYQPVPRLKDSPYLPLDRYAAPTFDEYAAGTDPALEEALRFTPPAPPATAADSLRAGMVLIPAGEFMMGTPGGHYDPAHPVFIDSFYIDAREVTNGQYAAYCEATGEPYPEFWGMDEFRCGPGYPDHPVVGVSLRQARRYAAWAGKRIPTEAEWEYAARGGLAGKRFPTGDDLLPTQANYRVGPAMTGSVPVGCYPPNGYGLHDVAGNAVEWVNDLFEPFWYRESPYKNPTGPEKGFIAVIRGGGWHSGKMCCDVHNRNALKYTWVDIAVGFRCAADARP